MNDKYKDYLFNIGTMLAFGLVISSVILGWSYKNKEKGNKTVKVTGSARKRIKSDLVKWDAEVSYRSLKLVDAYERVSENARRVKEYIVKKGVAEDQITISAVSSQTLRKRDARGYETSEIMGYSLRQRVQVRSGDVGLISKIARESTELIRQGILIDSNPPEYFYTKLGDLKIEMLGEAAKDARMRANKIASSTESIIGKVRSARMGVMQITAADSTEVSDYGINDTSSIEKDVTAVVNLEFGVK